jgi:uncharacterized membrane protein (DUF106 family)
MGEKMHYFIIKTGEWLLWYIICSCLVF